MKEKKENKSKDTSPSSEEENSLLSVTQTALPKGVQKDRDSHYEFVYLILFLVLRTIHIN